MLRGRWTAAVACACMPLTLKDKKKPSANQFERHPLPRGVCLLRRGHGTWIHKHMHKEIVAWLGRTKAPATTEGPPPSALGSSARRTLKKWVGTETRQGGSPAALILMLIEL